MKIRVIHAMTGMNDRMIEDEKTILKKFCKPDTFLDIVCIEEGSSSIESYYDMYIGAVSTLKYVKEAENLGFDGVVITCFGNACLDPAKEIVNIPVTASGEASMLLAAALGQRFSIIGTLKQARDRHEIEAMKLGVRSKFISERYIDMSVLDLHKDKDKTLNAMIKAAKMAIEEDGAEVIIPGCFGMIGMAEKMQRELGVPVIEPAGAVIKFIETLVDLKLASSPLSYPIPPIKKRSYDII